MKMKKLNKSLLFLLVLFSLTNVKAEFRFDYDYCIFRNQDSRLYLEFYYSFYQNQLMFVKSGDGYEANGLLDLEIVNKTTGTRVIQQVFKVPLFVQDTAGYNRSNNLTGQVNFLIDSGQYLFKIKATDFSNPVDSAKFEDNLSLSRFAEARVAISCIQISNGIEKTNDDKSVFYKNTLEVIPNPLSLFGNKLSTLYYYFELYNLDKNNISEGYTIKSEITDLNDAVIKASEKKYSLKSSSKVEVGSFDMADLKTNTYKLIIKILDENNSEVIRNQKKFIVFNSDTTGISGDYSQDNYQLSEYGVYSEEKLDDEFNHAIYIASDLEKKNYANLNNLEGKRKFMFNFWKNKDINKKEYMQRIKYANNNFAFDFTEGWKTDRGRIYVTYGNPDDIDRYPFESDKRAHEIWRYNSLEGGVIFVFVDLSNAAGNYGLVHSTARNELRNDQWEIKLRIK